MGDEREGRATRDAAATRTERAAGPDYYLVEARYLPEVFMRVMQTKELIASGEAKSIHEAVQTTGISRSAYYKYRDAILPFYESSRGHVVTLVCVIENLPGILAAITQKLASCGANVLTINQGLPIHGLADLTIAVETESLNCGLDVLMNELNRTVGLRSSRILARDRL